MLEVRKLMGREEDFSEEVMGMGRTESRLSSGDADDENDWQ